MKDKPKRLIFRRLVTFDSASMVMINELQRYGGFTDMAHVLQSALGLLDWAREKHAQGMKLAVFDPKTGEVVEVFPFPSCPPDAPRSRTPLGERLLRWLNGLG